MAIIPDGSVKSKTVTLVAATVSTVTLSGWGNKLCIYNVDAVAPVYATVNIVPMGETPAAAVPTVGGDDTWVINPPNTDVETEIEFQAQNVDIEVKLISSGTPTVNVQLSVDRD